MREGRETMTGVCWTNWTFYKTDKLQPKPKNYLFRVV